MNILDNIATKIAEKVNAKNDEVMSLTQENEMLQQKLAASELTASDYQSKVKRSDTEVNRISQNNDELKEKLREVSFELVDKNRQISDLSKSGELQVDVIQEYSERILELEEQLSKRSSKELKRQNDELVRISENQLKFIEILQVVASAKANKTQLKDVFSHNLCEYLVNNFDNVKQAADKLGINRTTLSELKSGKTALSYDNLDILDSKMCEYFECSVYELVTVKMEGK